MSDKKLILGLVGSPNTGGRTNQLVSAALEGAALAGIDTELVQMSEYVVDACKDCIPWVCAQNLKCTYDDKNFEILNKKILDCGGLILGTPVYWGDTSAMVRYLIIKMLRVFARSGPLAGLPALGTVIAGGSGNGMLSALRPLYHFFRIMRMRAIAPLPATRFDFEAVLEKARESGQKIGEMSKDAHPFEARDGSMLWYDNLPYLDKNSSQERKLLAALTTETVPEERKREIEGNLARVKVLESGGDEAGSLMEATKIYDSCVKIISR